MPILHYLTLAMFLANSSSTWVTTLASLLLEYLTFNNLVLHPISVSHSHSHTLDLTIYINSSTFKILISVNPPFDPTPYLPSYSLSPTMLCPYLGLQFIDSTTSSLSTHSSSFCPITSTPSPQNLPRRTSTHKVSTSSQPILSSHIPVDFHLHWNWSCQGHQWFHIAKPNDPSCFSGFLSQKHLLTPSWSQTLGCWFSSHLAVFSGSSLVLHRL